MGTRGNPAKDPPGLPDYIVALTAPSAYPHPTAGIELRQTHISYVLLTGRYAYKIKKPVNFGFLDYSTLDKRRHFCHEEVRLNSRMCSEIYLDVVEVREDDGRVAIGSGRRLLDYAVKMLQLPEERMMDRLLESDRVTTEMIQLVAAKLVDFYHHARTGPGIAQYGAPRWIYVNTEENFSQTRPYVGRTVSAAQYDLIKRYTEEFLADHVGVFEQRLVRGYIREGHGDLRPESICFTDGLCIYDCIEFNERFRCGDIALDIAFLVMELERRARFDLSREFVNTYVRLSGDDGISEVLDFYKVYRAYVRGKVESFKLEEPEIPDAEKRHSLAAARRYFDLAASYLQPLSPGLRY
ncbi:MAG: hypothetical protein HYY30_03270 [Chloroflexi bacterium]|nr:hypothetical protein [Chloroflexota bacterium]